MYFLHELICTWLCNSKKKGMKTRMLQQEEIIYVYLGSIFHKSYMFKNIVYFIHPCLLKTRITNNYLIVFLSPTDLLWNLNLMYEYIAMCTKLKMGECFNTHPLEYTYSIFIYLFRLKFSRI